MKCLLDTNVLISAWLWPESIPAHAVSKACAEPFRGYISQHSIQKLKDVVERKWPDRKQDLDDYLNHILKYAFSIDKKPEVEIALIEYSLRDDSDLPILLGAMRTGIDFIISGDRDFLDSGLTHPTILSPAQFVNMNEDQLSQCVKDAESI